MSFEAGDSNAFIASDRIQRYLRGRREQSMRQWLYQEEALKKATIDTARALKVLDVAGRRYKISYFNFPDSNFIAEMKREMKRGRSYEEVYFDVTGLDTLPQRQVEWSAHEHDRILDSLFMEPLQTNQIVGPVKTAEDEYLLIKINGWIDRPAITESQSRERWRDITGEYTQRSAAKLYDEFVRKVMKGKEIEFNPDIFFKVTDLMGPLYFKSNDEKIEIMKRSYWEQEDHQKEFQQLQDGIQALYPEPLFKAQNHELKHVAMKPKDCISRRCKKSALNCEILPIKHNFPIPRQGASGTSLWREDVEQKIKILVPARARQRSASCISP